MTSTRPQWIEQIRRPRIGGSRYSQRVRHFMPAWRLCKSSDSRPGMTWRSSRSRMPRSPKSPYDRFEVDPASSDSQHLSVGRENKVPRRGGCGNWHLPRATIDRFSGKATNALIPLQFGLHGAGHRAHRGTDPGSGKPITDFRSPEPAATGLPAFCIGQLVRYEMRFASRLLRVKRDPDLNFGFEDFELEPYCDIYTLKREAQENRRHESNRTGRFTPDFRMSKS